MESALSHFERVITVLCYLERDGRFVKEQWGRLRFCLPTDSTALPDVGSSKAQQSSTQHRV